VISASKDTPTIILFIAHSPLKKQTLSCPVRRVSPVRLRNRKGCAGVEILPKRGAGGPAEARKSEKIRLLRGPWAGACTRRVRGLRNDRVREVAGRARTPLHDRGRRCYIYEIRREELEILLPRWGVHIRAGDIVAVVAGDDKGKRGRVLSVDRTNNKIVVEGVNRVYKHVKPSRRNPQGGRLSKELPIDASNALLIDPQTNRPTRVGVRYLPDGVKELYAKKSGAAIRRLSKPRPRYAQKAK
jgi:large subunit ribosomal protein L24